jgi:hypothetical protein
MQQEIEISNFFLLLENKNEDHGSKKGGAIYESCPC